jgi:hypothetical protein
MRRHRSFAGNCIATALYLVGTAVAAGCAGPIDLKDTRSIAKAAERPAARSGLRLKNEAASPPRCEVYLIGVSDARESGAGITNTASIPIRHEDIVPWMKAGLLDWKPHGAVLRESSAQAAPEGKPRVQVELRKAYLQSLSTSMSANLVVAATFTGADGAMKHEFARGRDTSINWGNSTGEVQAIFDRALNDLLAHLEAGVHKLCE